MVTFMFLYGVHTKSWLATLIFLLFCLAIVIFEVVAVHFFVWCFWYPHQMKQWKKDFANAYDEDERRRLLFVRRKMRLFWIPFYFLKRF